MSRRVVRAFPHCVPYVIFRQGDSWTFQIRFIPVFSVIHWTRHNLSVICNLRLSRDTGFLYCSEIRLVCSLVEVALYQSLFVVRLHSNGLLLQLQPSLLDTNLLLINPCSSSCAEVAPALLEPIPTVERPVSAPSATSSVGLAQNSLHRPPTRGRPKGLSTDSPDRRAEYNSMI